MKRLWRGCSTTSICGSVKIFDAKQDSRIIGNSKTEDYFYPLNTPAEDILEVLVRQKRNVKRLEI